MRWWQAYRELSDQIQKQRDQVSIPTAPIPENTPREYLTQQFEVWHKNDIQILRRYNFILHLLRFNRKSMPCPWNKESFYLPIIVLQVKVESKDLRHLQDDRYCHYDCTSRKMKPSQKSTVNKIEPRRPMKIWATKSMKIEIMIIMMKMLQKEVNVENAK